MKNIPEKYGMKITLLNMQYCFHKSINFHKCLEKFMMC